MSELEKQKQTEIIDSSSLVDSGFEETLSVSQLEAVSVGMETINIITVKLPVKRNRVSSTGDEAAQQLKRSKLNHDEQPT